jgi:iron complex transport system ATP-binding protein
MAIERGQCWAIVGPNGSGKTTLLRLMAGLSKPRAGQVEIDGVRLDAMSARARAQRVAFVPQQAPTDLDFCVRDIVLMGRFPHRTLGLFESADDYATADRAMEATETSCFADRRLATLSGGEAQRVHVAAALAQQTGILLLDEPTASLDLQHQLAIFGILHHRAAEDRLAVVVVTHDVNLAAQFCTHVLVLHDGHTAATGSPKEVLTPNVLRPVYGVELLALTVSGDPDRRWIVPTHGPSEARR